MRHRILFPASLVALAAAGCAPKIQEIKPVAPQDYYYRAAPERVWNALLLVYTDLNIPIENMDKSSWFMRSRDMTLAPAEARAWMDCVAGEKGVNVSISVTTLLRPSGDSTAMRLALHVDATRNAGSGRVAIACSTRGALEQRVVELVRQRL